MIDVDLFPAPAIDAVQNQGTRDGCTGWAGSKAMSIMYERKGILLEFSAPFLWWQERVMAGTTGQNVGVSSALIGAALTQYGCCTTATMSDDTAFDVPPSAAAIAEALQYKAASSVTYGLDTDPTVTIARIQQSLLQGQIVCVTINVDAAFEALTGPWQSMTWDASGASLGQHEIIIGGWSESSQRFRAQNSWGAAWGDGGFLGIPTSLFTPDFIVGFEEITPACGLVNAGWRPTWTPSQSAVQRLYIAYLGRPADIEGLYYWDAQFATSGSAVDMIAAMAASAEAQAMYGGASPGAILTAVYQNLFGHAPAPYWTAFWANAVSSGQFNIGAAIAAIQGTALGADADAIAAKTEAAGLVSMNYAYASANIPAARAWLAGINTAAQVQPAVENPPL